MSYNTLRPCYGQEVGGTPKNADFLLSFIECMYFWWVLSLTLWQSSRCFGAVEVTVKDMDKLDKYKNHDKTQQGTNRLHISSVVLYDAWKQSSWGQHGAHLGPTGPKWAPCWPKEPCYLGWWTLFKRSQTPTINFIVIMFCESDMY